MSETRFYPVVTNNTDSIEKLDGQIIFDIDNKSISIDIDNSRFAVQSVDSELSEISKNPVQNKVIAEKLYDIEEKISEIEVPEIPELPTDLVRGTGKLFTLTSEEAIQEHLTYDDLGALISYIGEDVYDEAVLQSDEPELKYEKNSLYLVVETIVKNADENGADSKEISAKKVDGNDNKAPIVDDVFITKTEDEANALLVEENLGKLVSYVGENTGTDNPTKKGDTVTQVYFNTSMSAEEVYNLLADATFNLTAEGFSVVTLFGTAAWGSDANPIGQISYAVADIDENGNKLYYILNESDDHILWAYSPTLDASVIEAEAWGWQKSSPYTVVEQFTIAYMSNKDIWGSFLSAHENEFASEGPYKKNTLYIIAEEEKEAPEIKAGDVIDQLYFDTSLSDEEMLTNLSVLTYDEGFASLIDGSNDGILAAIDLNAIGASGGYALISMQPTSLDILYASEAMEANPDLEIPAASKGWNDALIIGGAYTVNPDAGDVDRINQQDLWKRYISKEPFIDSISIIAKPIIDPSLEKSELPEVSAADAGKVLSVTSNGTWAAAAPETAFQQINISLSDTSFVTRDIDPNVFYVFDQPLQVSLTINLNEGKPGVMHEYMFQFSVGYDLTLNLPGNVRWINQESPTFTAGHTYQVSILNNLAVYGEF